MWDAWAPRPLHRCGNGRGAVDVPRVRPPIRSDATTVPLLAQKWAAEPIYRVSYDQLTTGAEDASTAGSLIGDYQGVRDAVKDGMLSMLTGGLSPTAALQKAQQEADAAIKTYNDRIGTG